MKKIIISFCLIVGIFFSPNVLANKKNIVYIYNDEGVSKESLAQTIGAFKNILKKYEVKTIDSQQVKEGVWSKDAILFVMPGGADLPYVKKLNGKGNSIIKKYVKDGGSFLGICAGSYYGSSYVEFDKNGALEVLGDRELAFFKGKAIGPILAPYDYKTESGSRAAKINTIFDNVTETVVFFNGGGFFENAADYPNTKVIATYENKLPAIILVNYGKGKVLLSGVHFEYDPSLLNDKDNYIQKIIDPLKKANDSRKTLFNNLIKIAGVE